jgi:PAS domain S-box-containing protein
MSIDLVKYRQNYQQIVEASLSGMIVVDEVGRIILVNKMAEKIFGYSQKDLLTMKVEDILPQRMQTMDPEYRKAFDHESIAWPKAGEELYGLRHDGSKMPIEIVLNPIETVNGKLVIVSIVDITVKKKAVERLQQVVELAPNAMILLNEQGAIQLVNKAAEKLFGYSRGDLLTMKVEHLMPERFRGGHGELRKGYHQSPKTRPMGEGRDLVGLKRDGSEVPIEIGLTPIETESGTMVLASIVDVYERDLLNKKNSEIKRLLEEEVTKQTQVINRQRIAALNVMKDLKNKNEELKYLDGLKDEFMNNVSHELRTPLTIIRESINQVMDGLFGEINEKQNLYLRKSLNNVDRLSRIINDLLDLSTIEKGKLKLYKETVNMVELVKDVIANFTPQIDKKGLVIKCAVPEHKVKVFVDKEKMIQVLTNLINNAYKFTDRGSIEVSVSETDKSIECRVKDTGIGIAPQDQSRLFSKFEQVAKKSGIGPQGTGLGLSIAKGIIELHDGQIKLESELGKGSQFIISLPKLDIPQESARNLVNFLRENIQAYNYCAILVFSIKKFNETKDEALNDLETLIRRKLYRQVDQTVKDQGSVYVVLPDTKKNDVPLIVDRIRHAIHENKWKEQLKMSEGVEHKSVNIPEDGCVEKELIAKLAFNKEDL